MVNQVILSRLMPANRRESDESNELPWLLLSTIAKKTYHKFLNKAIYAWGKTPLAKWVVI